MKVILSSSFSSVSRRCMVFRANTNNRIDTLELPPSAKTFQDAGYVLTFREPSRAESCSVFQILPLWCLCDKRIRYPDILHVVCVRLLIFVAGVGFFFVFFRHSLSSSSFARPHLRIINTLQMRFDYSGAAVAVIHMIPEKTVHHRIQLKPAAVQVRECK